MANRRAFETISQLLLQEWFNKREEARRTAADRETNKLNQGSMAERELLGAATRDPFLGLRLSQRGPAQLAGIDTSILEPGQQEIFAPSTARLNEATGFSEIPSGEALIADAASRGPIRELGPLTRTLNLRNQRWQDIARAGDLDTERAGAEAFTKALETGRGENTALNMFQPDALRRQQTEFEQELEQGVTRERTMRPEEARTAAAITGAQEDAKMTPERIAARVNELMQEEFVRSRFKAPTDSQARAQGLSELLVQADVGARGLEEQGVDLNFGTQTLGNIPFANRMIGNEQRQYLQYAQQFLNIATLIMTGVTARPDEYVRYTGTLFALDGDDTQTRAQKRAARQQFFQSVQQRAMSGGQVSIEEVQGVFDEILGNLGLAPEGGTQPIDPQAAFAAEAARRGLR